MKLQWDPEDDCCSSWKFGFHARPCIWQSLVGFVSWRLLEEFHSFFVKVNSALEVGVLVRKLVVIHRCSSLTRRLGGVSRKPVEIPQVQFLGEVVLLVWRGSPWSFYRCSSWARWSWRWCADARGDSTGAVLSLLFMPVAVQKPVEIPQVQFLTWMVSCPEVP